MLKEGDMSRRSLLSDDPSTNPFSFLLNFTGNHAY